MKQKNKCIKCGYSWYPKKDKRSKKCGKCGSIYWDYPKKAKHPRWKGGRTKDSLGYILLWKPNHPSNSNGYVKEHRYKMEEHLGRILSENEVVHHKNRIRDDNRIENLELMGRKEHHRHHAKEWMKNRNYKGNKNPNWKGGRTLPKNCVDCGKETDFRVELCRSCSMKRARKNKFWVSRKKKEMS